LDIENWFVIDSPAEMSEAFASVTAIYFAAQTGAHSLSAQRQIERRLDGISGSAEWFAASMYLEAVRERRLAGVRWRANR